LGAIILPDRARDAWRSNFFAAIVLGLACVALFPSCPTNGDFWWPDAPGHAMNGAFVRDLIVAMPADPVRWAIDYYLRLPGVTILFYPPLFPVVEGLAFLIFGISHAVAQATVLLFVWLFALGVFALCRERLSPAASLGGALLALGMPAVALWGRQVMLELPACACATWSAVFLLRYLRTGSPRLLYGAVVVFCLILYTKQTFAFLGIVFIVLLALEQGAKVFLSKEIWIAAGIGVVLLIPFALMTYAFGRFNMTLAVAQPVEDHVTNGAFYYVTSLPQTAGWPVLLLTVAGAAWALRRGLKRPDTLTLLLLIWVVVGFIVFSFVALKDGRYALHMLLPFAVFAAMFMDRLLQPRAGVRPPSSSMCAHWDTGLTSRFCGPRSFC
jgi:4-amino-4-deoxy-L-arabinose transferase-like glycosyltransferase